MVMAEMRAYDRPVALPQAEPCIPEDDWAMLK